MRPILLTAQFVIHTVSAGLSVVQNRDFHGVALHRLGRFSPSCDLYVQACDVMFCLGQAPFFVLLCRVADAQL